MNYLSNIKFIILYQCDDGQNNDTFLFIGDRELI